MKIINYDSQLSIKKKLNGTKIICRSSPFKHQVYDIFEIKNRFIGSSRWIFQKLFKMDAQKRDIIPNYIKQHKRLELKPQTAMHKDIARFVVRNEQILI